MVGATNISYTVTLNNNTAYKSYRFRSTAGVTNPGLSRIQFYSVSLDIPTPISPQDKLIKIMLIQKLGNHQLHINLKQHLVELQHYQQVMIS